MAIKDNLINAVDKFKKYNSIEEQEKRLDNQIKVEEKRLVLEKKRKKLAELQKKNMPSNSFGAVSVEEIFAMPNKKQMFK